MMVSSLLSFAGACLCGGLAAVVLCKDSRSFVHRAFAVGMIAFALEEVFTGLSAQAVLPATLVHWQGLRMGAAGVLPGTWLLFSLRFARANYQAFLARWKWFVPGSFALPLALVTFCRDGLFALPPAFDEPSGTLIPLGWSGHLFFVFFLFMSVTILMNLEGTLRASAGSKRRQIKFIVLGLGSLFAVRIYTVSQTLLFSSVNMTVESVNSYAVIVANVLIILSSVRMRLPDVDIYLSQGVLYKSITVLVVGIYLLAVGVLAKAVSYFDASAVLPLGTFFVFLGLMGLSAILLSDHLRQQIKRFISRNFHRPHYDYRKEWTAFTQRTTSLVDIKALCATVSRMVSETFGVPSVTIWLLDGMQDQLVLGGSTVFSEGQSRHLKSTGKGLASLIRALHEQQVPIDVERSADDWAGLLKQSCHAYLGQAHIRYGVPLVAGRQILGLMTLNDRLTREPFSVEEFDLLKTLADQAAASLLHLKLSERLLRAKEMETFQTLSAFFIHDLKNLASTLSLTLENLPAHYDDPAFRHDMLRVISQSVARIHAMCSGLSPLSKTLELQKIETDLNNLVTTSLASLDGSLKVSLVQDLQPVPRLAMDPNQMQKVLVNLLLNANEAAGSDGRIRVATGQQDGWVVLSVSDNGCGMSKAFVEGSLFRPFQTTKEQGLGIGLFHSKLIIEAHQGKIEVESEAGKGSTFRVMLPGTRAG